jgi:hypothetical protein
MAEWTGTGTVSGTAATEFDSTSTLTELRDGYADNASYEQDASVSKAKTFVTVCRILLLRLMKRAQHGSNEEYEFDPALIRDEMTRATTWLAGNDTSNSSVKFTSFENFR